MKTYHATFAVPVVQSFECASAEAALRLARDTAARAGSKLLSLIVDGHDGATCAACKARAEAIVGVAP